MRLFWIVVVVLVIACFINFVRTGETFHIAEVLPFGGGHEAGLYDLASFIVIGLGLWGYGRLRRMRSDR